MGTGSDMSPAADAALSKLTVASIFPRSLVSSFRSRYLANRDHHPELVLTVLSSGPFTEIEVAGVLDLSTTHLLTAQVDQLLLAYAPRWLVLDLARVRLLCGAGITALQRIRDDCAAHDGQLTLRNPSAMVCKVLDITNLADRFDVRSAGVGRPSVSADPSTSRPGGRIDA